MSIHFACPHCDHPIEVEDRLAGLAGHCKHCGQTMTVPAGPTVATTPGLKLRPVEGLDQPGVPNSGTAPPAALLQVRPLAAAEPAVAPAIPVDERPIEVLDPYHFADQQKRRVPLNPHYETRIARAAARFLRINRDRLYLISLALLVTTLIGVLFHLRPLLHLGMVGVVLANALMLVDGILYLLVIPFRESLAEGIGATLFPPYHWIRHWDRMRGPFLGTVRSFVPVFLAGLVWVFYEEAPVIWDKVEQVDRVVEKSLGIDPRPTKPAPQPGPRQPGIAEKAQQALGGEARIIENLSQP